MTDNVEPVYLQHSKHIVKSFDDDLHRLSAMLTEMGGRVQHALKEALSSLENNDGTLAQNVIDGEFDIDRLENDIDMFAIRILALRQPVAQDLRRVVTAIKISAHLERIADYAEHMAIRQSALKGQIQRFPHQLQLILTMGHEVNVMLDQALKAFSEHDLSLAKHVWQYDDKVDALYAELLQDMMVWMKDNPDEGSISIHLLFMAKNIERMGDHITNIAEHIYYLVEGRLWKEAFPNNTAKEPYQD